jgi:hypothetical protein
VVTWDDVVALGNELPEVEEGTSYGRPALSVRGRMFVALRSKPDALVVRCDLEEKPFLLEARSDVLFETPHYHGYSAMLVSLEASIEDAREFVLDSYVLVAPKKLADSVSLDA